MVAMQHPHTDRLPTAAIHGVDGEFGKQGKDAEMIRHR